MTHSSQSPVSGYLFILVAVLFWGGSASLAKFLFTTRYDALIITQTRTSLSFVLMALYFAFRNRNVFRIRPADLPSFALIGIIGIAVTNYAYYFTVQESTVATAILVQYTAPVLVMLYSVLVARLEVLTGAKVVALILSMAGCWLAVSGGEWSAIQLRGWAIVSGIASSVCFAFMLLLSKHILRSYSVWTMLTYAFGFAAIFWLMINDPWEISRQAYTAKDWGVFWVFAVISILIPHSLFSAGLKILDASTVGIVTTMEPVVAIVVAFFTLGETLTVLQWFGALAVVAAVILLQVRALKRPPEKVRNAD